MGASSFGNNTVGSTTAIMHMHVVKQREKQKADKSAERDSYKHHREREREIRKKAKSFALVSQSLDIVLTKESTI